MDRRGFVKRLGVVSGLIAASGPLARVKALGQNPEAEAQGPLYDAAIAYLRAMNTAQLNYNAKYGHFADEPTFEKWRSAVAATVELALRNRVATRQETSPARYRILLYDRKGDEAFFTDQRGVIFVGRLARASVPPEFSDFVGVPLQRPGKRPRSTLWAPLEALIGFYFPTLSADEHSCPIGCGHCTSGCDPVCQGCQNGVPCWCCNMGYEDCPNCCGACGLPCQCPGVPFNPCDA